MNTLIGIVIALISYLPASQLWEIYKREKVLIGLIKDQKNNITALESDNFINEPVSAMEQQLNLASADYPYALRIAVFEGADKSATRRILYIWGGVWVVLLLVLFQIGIGYLIAAIVLAIVGGTNNLSKQGNISALQHYRLILKTFIDWKNKDVFSLDEWLQQNKKYETMIEMVKLSKR